MQERALARTAHARFALVRNPRSREGYSQGLDGNGEGPQGDQGEAHDDEVEYVPGARPRSLKSWFGVSCAGFCNHLKMI